ncbi:UDP-2,3-diacylglucosamine diphosphatase [Balneolales bacterium ANBcel1]|nr:UDP-2,3-diacylglucosamine diphosphatase [Balneolales bacterium ANBcel1]
MENRRNVDIVVLSDVHLGSFGCHSAELVAYLKSIKPRIIVLNGDLLDVWQFKKYYWPDTHMEVLKCIMGMLGDGTRVYYLTGNHDELLRKYSPFRLGGFHLADKVVLNIDGKKAWIFHGDVFDVTMQYSKFIAKLGGRGYNLLILLNKMINYVTMRTGKGRMSFSKRIKDSVKTAVKFISRFEITATDLAIEKGYDYVICGHIHRPNIETFTNKKGTVTYLNSGDWVENLTALEYHEKKWSIYRYPLDGNLLQQAEYKNRNTSEQLPISEFALFEESMEFDSIDDLGSLINHNILLNENEYVVTNGHQVPADNTR